MIISKRVITIISVCMNILSIKTIQLPRTVWDILSVHITYIDAVFMSDKKV